MMLPQVSAGSFRQRFVTCIYRSLLPEACTSKSTEAISSGCPGGSRAIVSALKRWLGRAETPLGPAIETVVDRFVEDPYSVWQHTAGNRS